MTAVDLLVVGGGPSGLSAAAAAAEGGAAVTLVDEWPTLGGRLRYRRADVEVGGRTVRPANLIESLVARARDAGVDLRPGTVAWSAFAGSRGLEIGVRGIGDAAVLTPDRLVLATGTTDRAAIVPGATLPGVLTARALQILLHIHGVRPGRRFAILGDDRAHELIDDIAAAGGEVVRVVPPTEVVAVVVHGQDGVQGISVRDERTSVDVVVVAIGTLPDTQLARMNGDQASPRVALCGSAAWQADPVGGAATVPTTFEAAMDDGERAGR